MVVLEGILKFFDLKMTRPTDYGWFHILSLLIMVFTIILLSKKYKNCDSKKVKKIIFTCSLICIILEIYKQINFNLFVEESKIIWDYKWYAFPYQFCSVPMYIAFIAGLTKNKKIEYACYSFLSTYALVGGICVMLYPNTVFIETIGINLQTMIHHGLMVVMGAYLVISKRVQFNFKTLLNAFYVFLIVLGIALVLNILTYYLSIGNGLELFYISPFHTSSLPVFSIIYEKVPYILFLLTYIFLFTFGSGITLLISKLISKK